MEGNKEREEWRGRQEEQKCEDSGAAQTENSSRLQEKMIKKEGKTHERLENGRK